MVVQIGVSFGLGLVLYFLLPDFLGETVRLFVSAVVVAFALWLMSEIGGNDEKLV